MSESFIDLIGKVFWYLIFLTPIITLPVTFRLNRLKNVDKIYKIIIGITLAFILSFFFYIFSILIIFRNGVEPS